MGNCLVISSLCWCRFPLWERGWNS